VSRSALAAGLTASRAGAQPTASAWGVLSWLIEQGTADDIDLSGPARRIGVPYSDGERGSPRTWVLYLDARASQEQRAALEAIFTGHLGGDAERHFPWAWKASELVAVRPAEITVDHTRRRDCLRIRDHVSVRIRGRYECDETVSCVIPGHQRAGEELVADELVVEDGKLSFDFGGACGYGSAFEMRASQRAKQRSARRVRRIPGPALPQPSRMHQSRPRRCI
jgi:hypothetical protein